MGMLLLLKQSGNHVHMFYQNLQLHSRPHALSQSTWRASRRRCLLKLRFGRCTVSPLGFLWFIGDFKGFPVIESLKLLDISSGVQRPFPLSSQDDMEEPLLTSEELIENAQSEVKLDEHGALWFYFIDAFEDDRSNPPRVYLFGKVQSVQSGRFSSCCLVVEKLERCLHLLLKVETADIDNEELKDKIASAAATAAEKEFDAICQKQYPNVKKLRSKLKWRNYAFEKDLPQGHGHLAFLKVVCDASGGLPGVSSGENFSHVFGVQTSLLERLVLTKQIMGPSWIRLKPGSFRKDPVRLSHCAHELRITPDSFHTCKTEAAKAELAKLMPSVVPPLRMMSLSLQTVQTNPQGPHEVLAIACTLHPNVRSDASTEQTGFGKWTALRRFDIKPLPPDADKAGLVDGWSLSRRAYPHNHIVFRSCLFVAGGS